VNSLALSVTELSSSRSRRNSAIRSGGIVAPPFLSRAYHFFIFFAALRFILDESSSGLSASLVGAASVYLLRRRRNLCRTHADIRRRQLLRSGKALRRLAENAGQSKARSCYRRVYAGRPELRCDPRGLLQRPRADVRREGARASRRRYAPRYSRNSTGSKPNDAHSGTCPSHGAASGEGVTAAEVEKCRWLKPRLAASIEYLEWTGANHLRHSKFAGLTKNSAFRAS
jgi:hypothetical protein